MPKPQDDPLAALPEPPATYVDASEVIALAPVALGACELDGTLLFGNEALAHLLGLDDADALVGESLTRFYASPESLLKVLKEGLAEEFSRRFEVECVRADGEALCVRLDARLHRRSEDSVVHFTATTRGCVCETTGKAPHGRTPGAVEHFAAGMTHVHDFLTSLIGEAQEIVADLPASTASHEGGQSIMRRARRAAEIAGRLLAYCRAAKGRPQAVDVNEAVHDAKASLEALGLDVSLVVRPDLGVGAAWIDPEHLRVILTNVIQNAWDASPDGGQVVVETMIVTSPQEVKGLDFQPPVPPGEYVSVAIGDTGRGLEPGTHGLIFDPFRMSTEPGKGGSLALQKVFGMVLLASGYLAVISAPGWGTIVRILLPRVPSAPTADAAASAVPDRRATDRSENVARSRRILVVDDEGSVLRLVSRILDNAGYVVHQAASAFEAQDEIRRLGCDLDLVISDVMMPHMKGTELMAWLRERCPSASVLLVSGYANSELVRKWVEADPNSFLPKPFGPTELLERVRQRLGDTVNG